jgi:phosphoglucosamine mutase
VTSEGGEVLLGGVLPTPAAPLLLHRYGFDVAAVISASHNPYRDNGIKFFGATATSCPTTAELAIERRLEDPPARCPSASARCASCAARTRTTCASCSSASTASTCPAWTSCWTARTARPQGAPEAFRRLGAEPTVLAAEPDGRNINEGCGSTHVEALAERVVAGGHASASRSTATATASWPWTGRAPWSTATSSSPSRRSTCATRAASAAGSW